MKKIFQLLACGFLALAAASCSQGATAINKAFEEAGKAEPSEKIATTLCNGEIKCSTLTSDELAKLGAVLDYLQNHGMYSANFEAQVDMYQFGNLLQDYRNVEKNVDMVTLRNYVRELQINLPEPPPAPEGNGACPPPPAQCQEAGECPPPTPGEAPGEVPPPPAPEK